MNFLNNFKNAGNIFKMGKNAAVKQANPRQAEPYARPLTTFAMKGAATTHTVNKFEGNINYALNYTKNTPLNAAEEQIAAEIRKGIKSTVDSNVDRMIKFLQSQTSDSKSQAGPDHTPNNMQPSKDKPISRS